MADAMSVFNIALFVSMSLTAKDILLKPGVQKSRSQNKIAESGGSSGSGGAATSGLVGPHMKFLFCYECGYKKVFQEYATAIQQRYPQIHISGDHYPPGPTEQMIAQVLSALKWVVLGFIIFGDKIQLWTKLGMAPPPAYTWVQNHKVASCFVAFLVCNGIGNILNQTGAFEVELNGVPIWSKLNTSRMPEGNELFEIIEKQMPLSTPDLKNRFPGSVRVGDFNYDQNESEKEEDIQEEDDEEDDIVEDTLEGEEEKVEDDFEDIDDEIHG